MTNSDEIASVESPVSAKTTAYTGKNGMNSRKAA